MANKREEDEKSDDDNLDDEELPQPARKKKITLNVPEDDDISISAKSRLQLALYYIKMVFLCSIWLVMAVLLPTMPIEKKEGYLTTIFPNQSKNIIINPKLITRESLGLRVYGPFLVSAHATSVVPGANNHMKATLEKVLYAAEDGASITNVIVVSNTQHFLLSTSEQIAAAVPVKMHAYFGLTNFSTEEGNGKVQLRLRLETDVDTELTIKYFLERSLDAHTCIVLGALVLAFLYVSIVWELVNRTFVSVIAATLAIAVLGFMRSWPDLTKIITWMDTETLLLLFGMMILVGVLAESGIFDYFAVQAYRMSRGHIWPMVNTLCFFTATLSAFVDSVTMMLLITPLIVKLCEVMQADPVLVLMFLVIYANVGAASTPVGDPPNIIITTNSFIASHNVHFGNFMMHTLPCVLLALLQTYIQIRLTFRHKLGVPYLADTRSEMRMGTHAWERAAAGIQPYSKDTRHLRDVLRQKARRVKRHIRRLGKRRTTTADYHDTLANLRASYGIRNKMLLIKSVIAFAFVMMLFFLHSVHGLHQLTLGECALMGAILLLILADVNDMEAILGRVEWSTLIFFGSLFVLMEALTEIGVIAVLGNMVENLVRSVDEKQRLLVAIQLLLWVSAIASAFLDNIPVTTMMIRIVISLSQNKELHLPLHPLVWALALGACFGGNGTLIGGSANVVTAGVAEQHGYTFTFKQFFIVGFPIMIGNVLITSIYLYVCHSVFEWHDPPIS